MKKGFILICLCSFLSAVYGQHAQLTISNEFEVAEKEYRDQKVSNAIYYNNSFYSATNSAASASKWLFTKLYDIKFKVSVSHFDKEMKLLKTIEIDGGDKKFGPLIPELLIVNQELFLAYFQANDDKASFNLYLAKVNDDDLTLGNAQKICTIQQENVGIFKIESVVNGGLIVFTASPDGKKLLIACKPTPNKLQTLLFDNNLKLIRQTNTNISADNFEIATAVTSSTDKSFVMLNYNEETKLLCFGPDGAKVEHKLKTTSNLQHKNLNITLSHDGTKLYVHGNAKPTSPNNIAEIGIVIQQLDVATLQLSKPSYFTFGTELAKLIIESGGGVMSKREQRIYDLQTVLTEMPDGRIALVGSTFETEVSTSTRSSSIGFGPNAIPTTKLVSTTTFYAGPLITLVPNFANTQLSANVIPRKIILSKMASSGSGAIKIVSALSISNSSSSFVVRPIGNEIVILYNDNTKNVNASADSKVITTTNNTDLELVEAVIGADNNLKYKNVLGNTQKRRATFYLGRMVPTTTSQIIFPIAKEGAGFNTLKTYYTNWCFIDIK